MAHLASAEIGPSYLWAISRFSSGTMGELVEKNFALSRTHPSLLLTLKLCAGIIEKNITGFHYRTRARLYFPRHIV